MRGMTIPVTTVAKTALGSMSQSTNLGAIKPAKKPVMAPIIVRALTILSLVVIVRAFKGEEYGSMPSQTLNLFRTCVLLASALCSVECAFHVAGDKVG